MGLTINGEWEERQAKTERGREGERERERGGVGGEWGKRDYFNK